MERERRVTSVRQLELLVAFMRSHKDLALGRLKSKEARATAERLTRELAELLNPEGPMRTPKEWIKVWNDLKSKVKLKLISIKKGNTGTGGGPHVPINLSPIEDQVTEILGRDCGYIDGVNVEGQVEMNNDDEGERAHLHDNWHMENPTNYDDTVMNFNMDTHEANGHDYIVPDPVESVTVPTTPQPSSSIRDGPPETPPAPPAPPARPHLRDRRTIRPRPRRSAQEQPTARTGAGGNLADVHAAMSRIEVLRAESSRDMATAAVGQAQAAQLQAEAVMEMARAMSRNAEAAMENARATTRQVEAILSMAQSYNSIAASMATIATKISGTGHLP